MVLIIRSSYKSDYQDKRKPLLIGCSGGGGHNQAIKGIRVFLEKTSTQNIKLPQYDPALYGSKPDSRTRVKIETGVGLMHTRAIGKPVQVVVSLTPYPVLPDPISLDKEINNLSNNEKKAGKRQYIDMLLDVYPAGYESAAIWNVLQRSDKTSELKKLIDFQSMNDRNNHDVVYDYYLDSLKKAALNNDPYTELISTQAMALPALCDAVKKYNKWRIKEKPDVPEVVIHQYMTDLPTKGAVHFFNALSTLTPEQQAQMKLYAVGMNNEVMAHFFPPKGKNSFKEILNIPAENNPMVRQGFKNPALDNHAKFGESVSITVVDKDANPIIYRIKANEQIASIMLGSQAGNDTVEYIAPLLEKGIDTVFVFGGQSPNIKNKIDEIMQNQPKYKDKIIPLANQQDEHIAPLMSRSNIVVIRGGGLSVMEQLAMQHNTQQAVLVHHANSSKKELTSGISWEDDNVAALITALNSRNVHAEKTTPARAVRQIAEARLIAAVKKMGNETEINIHDATQFIKKLPKHKLDVIVKNLHTSENENPPRLPKELDNHLIVWEKNARYEIERLNKQLNQVKTYLEEIIFVEAEEFGPFSQYYKTDSDGNLIKSKKTNSMNPFVYDIDALINQSDQYEFKNASHKFISAIKSYKAIIKLQVIISDTSNSLNHGEVETKSANEKLEAFKKEYQRPETKKNLLFGNDSLLRRLIKEIEYILIKYFPAMERNISATQLFRKKMDDLADREVENINSNKGFSPQLM